MLMRLWYKHNSFSKNNKLADDGSFYYDDERLAQEMYCSKKTIMRAKRFLVAQGFIRCSIGSCRGKATKYWVVGKPDKKSPFVDISKPDNLTIKPDSLSVKASPNVMPNKINNKEKKQ